MQGDILRQLAAKQRRAGSEGLTLLRNCNVARTGVVHTHNESELREEKHDGALANFGAHVLREILTLAGANRPEEGEGSGALDTKWDLNHGKKEASNGTTILVFGKGIGHDKPAEKLPPLLTWRMEEATRLRTKCLEHRNDFLFYDDGAVSEQAANDDVAYHDYVMGYDDTPSRLLLVAITVENLVNALRESDNVVSSVFVNNLWQTAMSHRPVGSVYATARTTTHATNSVIMSMPDPSAAQRGDRTQLMQKLREFANFVDNERDAVTKWMNSGGHRCPVQGRYPKVTVTTMADGTRVATYSDPTLAAEGGEPAAAEGGEPAAAEGGGAIAGPSSSAAAGGSGAAAGPSSAAAGGSGAAAHTKELRPSDDETTSDSDSEVVPIFAPAELERWETSTQQRTKRPRPVGVRLKWNGDQEGDEDEYYLHRPD
jgi:hypothetical protein